MSLYDIISTVLCYLYRLLHRDIKWTWTSEHSLCPTILNESTNGAGASVVHVIQTTYAFITLTFYFSDIMACKQGDTELPALS